LSNLLRSVIKEPNSINNWLALLKFGDKILRKPTRGGVHRNLSSIVTHRCKDFNANITDLNHVNKFQKSRRDVKTKDRNDNEEIDNVRACKLGKTVSMKIEEGKGK